MKTRKGKNKLSVYKPYKGFGKQNVTEKDIQSKVESLLSGKELLICARIQDETGTGCDMAVLVEISKLSEVEELRHVQLAYNIATQKEMINLGIRRQHTHGRGLINLMSSDYARLLMSPDYDRLLDISNPSVANGVTFNWLTISELKQAPRESALFVNTNILKPLTLALSTNCNVAHEFPCLFTGLPTDDEKNCLFHLLFIVKDSNPSKVNLNPYVKEDLFDLSVFN